MQSWWVLSLRIGAFGFLKEFRPEDPYISQYLVGPVMNLTDEEVNQKVYPIATYVGLVQIIFVFLLTDFLCYKPIIVLNALCGVISQGILIWGRGLRAVQVMEFFYATMTVCEVAYYTYIYAKVDKEHYQKVTSHMRAAALTGRFTSAVTSQTVLSLGILTVADLNHLTFGGMCCALICALTLPSMSHSLYFHRKGPSLPPQDHSTIEQTQSLETSMHESSRLNSNHTKYTAEQDMDKGDSSETKTTNLSGNEAPYSDSETIDSIKLSRCNQGARLLWKDFKDAYTNLYVLKFCIWVALATCGYNQMMSYVQILWLKIGGKQQVAYNGAVEAVYTIISAVSTLAFGQVRANWPKYGEALLGFLTLLQGAVLIISANTDSMLIAYAAYVVFGMLYNVMLVMTNSEVARHINQDSYALIFGVNTFIALILQTILTLLVAGEGGFEIPIRNQFLVYGGYFIVLGGIYAVKSFLTICAPHHAYTTCVWLGQCVSFK